MPTLLRASHIKPWRAASGAERLDKFNGLLLTPNLDLAFDQGLISFDDHGQILLGEDLDPDSARALNITPTFACARSTRVIAATWPGIVTICLEVSMSISSTIKSIQDIMRKDVGVDGDAQRIGQLVWLLFLKIFDDRELEWELMDDNYRSPIPKAAAGAPGLPTRKA